MGNPIPPTPPDAPSPCDGCLAGLPDELYVTLNSDVQGFQHCDGVISKREPDRFRGIIPCVDGSVAEITVRFCQDSNGLAAITSSITDPWECSSCGVSGVFCGGFSCFDGADCSFSICS